MKERVIVTPRSMSRGESEYLHAVENAGYELVFPSPGRQPVEEELIAAVDGVVGYVAGVEPITAPVLRAADSLRAISRNGVGIENIDLAVARERNITILRAHGANARGVAELTVLHMLLLRRKALSSIIQLREHNWAREKGSELAETSLGIVGMGSVGVLVASLATAFGMRILVHDPFPSDEAKSLKGVKWTSMDDLWHRSEIVTLHCSAAEDGTPLVNRERLEQVREGTLLINTARSALVDDEAVLAALESGKLAGYSVDAYHHEPPSDWRIINHPKVIATPHMGAFTDESSNRAAEAAVNNLVSALKASQ